MCHFCHRLGMKPDAPDHRSKNCRDSRNQFSKYYKSSSHQPSSHQPSSQPSRLAGIPWKHGHGSEAVQNYASRHGLGPTSSHATSSHATSSHATSSHASSSHATSSHASSSHATSSHATSSRATSSHATSSHATSSRAFSLIEYHHQIGKIYSILPSDPSRVFHVTNPRGCVQVMKDLNKLVPAPITLVLASNSGRPGGSCSRRNGRNFVPDIEALTSGKHYKTNEESVLSTLALESPPAILNAMEGLYLQYGMCDASGSDTLTRQGIDYTIAEPPEYQKAWTSIWIDSNKSSVLLVAACAPNVGEHPKDPMSTMRRTYSEKLAQHFDLFRLAWSTLCMHPCKKQSIMITQW